MVLTEVQKGYVPEAVMCNSTGLKHAFSRPRHMLLMTTLPAGYAWLVHLAVGTDWLLGTPAGDLDCIHILAPAYEYSIRGKGLGLTAAQEPAPGAASCLEATCSGSRLECVCHTPEKSDSEQGIVIVLVNNFGGSWDLQPVAWPIEVCMML